MILEALSYEVLMLSEFTVMELLFLLPKLGLGCRFIECFTCSLENRREGLEPNVTHSDSWTPVVKVIFLRS
jgi:hypothetical protein